MMEGDILKEVTQLEIPQVLKALKKDWPNHFILHQYITIMQDNNKKGLKTPAQMLYRYGPIDNGVYVVKTVFFSETMHVKRFFVYTTSNDLANVSKVLKSTSRVPWQDKDYRFELTLSHISSIIQQEALSTGLNLKVYKYNMLWYPPDCILQLKELPDDVYLDFLDQSHVKEVNDNWPYKSLITDQYIAQQIQSNFGLGIFRKNDKKMLSSALSFHSGGLFILFTDPQFRGKGYAEIIIRNFVKESRLRGSISFCCITPGNIVSENLFRKIGFIDYNQVDCILK